MRTASAASSRPRPADCLDHDQVVLLLACEHEAWAALVTAVSDACAVLRVLDENPLGAQLENALRDAADRRLALRRATAATSSRGVPIREEGVR